MIVNEIATETVAMTVTMTVTGTAILIKPAVLIVAGESIVLTRVLPNKIQIQNFNLYSILSMLLFSPGFEASLRRVL